MILSFYKPETFIISEACLARLELKFVISRVLVEIIEQLKEVRPLLVLAHDGELTLNPFGIET